MARARGSAATLLFKEESVYGTAPTGTYRLLPMVSQNLGKAQPLQDQNLLGMGRDPASALKDAITVDGNVVVPMDVRNLGYWLRMAFGAPVTTGSGPFTHSFRSGGAALPSASVEVGFPEVPDFPLHRGCMVNELSFETKRAGLVDATLGLIGSDETAQTTTKSASPTVADLVRFERFQGALLIDGAESGNLVSASFRYANNLDPIESIKAAIVGADPGVAAATGSLVMRFADKVLVDKAIAGTAIELRFNWDTGTHSISFVVHEVQLSQPKREHNGPGGVQVTFDWRGRKAASPTRMVTVTLVNDVSSY